MESLDLADSIVSWAKQLGFVRVALYPVSDTTSTARQYPEFLSWLKKDYHGTMHYLSESRRKAARAQIHDVFPSAKTAIILALPHENTPKKLPVLSDKPSQGIIAKYARGKDYHWVLRDKLELLAQKIHGHTKTLCYQPCTDSHPILERDLAARAGLGFQGKNTMLITPGVGSYFLLGELYIDKSISIETSTSAKEKCGSCQACIDACPTKAFVDSYVLDARRCISYLTIEFQGIIPRDLRAAMGNKIFGCDICQEVCPFNTKAPDRISVDPELTAQDVNHATPDLLLLATMSSNRYKRFIKGTPLSRVRRNQMLRNVCIALGNSGEALDNIPSQNNTGTELAIEMYTVLRDLLRHTSALVRVHSAWALGQLGALTPLREQQKIETDIDVLEEINTALKTPVSATIK